MIDFNVLYGIVGAVVLVLLVMYGFPYLRSRGVSDDIYADIKLGLLLFGYAFRDEKIRQITTLISGIVATLEKLDMSAETKKEGAVEMAFKELMEELDIVLDEEALSVIINIAVSYLPATHPTD